MTVPFLDLKIQHTPLMAEFEAAFRKVVELSAFAGGSFVERFEEEFAQFCGAAKTVGVGNGTDALWFALLALGVKPGDEVITVPSTFMATAEAITYCGAKPVFVDIEERTYTMDPAKLEAAITPRTKAIIPVHLFGQTCDMDPILAIAKKHNLPVVEDACQAHGAEYKGKKAGTIGEAGCFSFYPGKNLGALGEAGATVTNDVDLAKRMSVYRDHGQAKKYYHAIVGWNGRMDGIQGACLSVKLKHLAGYTDGRRKHSAYYKEALAGVGGIILPHEASYAKHVYHIFAVRVQGRDEFMQKMTAKGVSTGIHYPIPVHLQDAYRDLGLGVGSFPIAERCAQEFVSLPMFPELTEAQTARVVESVKECL